MNRAHDRQKGVAIITAMLVIALGTITIVALTSRQQLDLQRERNEGAILQARAFGMSGERFAAALLYRDVQDALRENSDSLDDDWAQTLPPVPIGPATISGCITDMQGRFNLNNIVNTEGQMLAPQVEHLQRLLTELTIDPAKAQAIVDWVDRDLDPQVPEGAEDDYYTSLDPGYRAANIPFTSISELQLVKGFSPAIEEERADYELLLPHVATLPIDAGPTPINVNTATPEVLASLSDIVKPVANLLSRWDTGAYEDYPACEDLFDLEADDGPETFVEERDTTPYESVDQFRQETGAGPDELAAVAPEGSIGVTSAYFQVRIDIAAESLVLTQYTLMERSNGGTTRIVQRSRDTL